MCFGGGGSAYVAPPAPVPTYEDIEGRTPRKKRRPMGQGKSNIFTSAQGVSGENVIKRSLLGGGYGS